MFQVETYFGWNDILWVQPDHDGVVCKGVRVLWQLCNSHEECVKVSNKVKERGWFMVQSTHVDCTLHMQAASSPSTRVPLPAYTEPTQNSGSYSIK
jgi:hypothetical protein